VKTTASRAVRLDWLTPFSLFTGFGLIVAYALLGSTWLIMKTEGALQSTA
jgi:cytochrome d ubiquinol oxidase subunit II